MFSIAQPSRLSERFSPAPSDKSPVPAETVIVKAAFDQLKQIIADSIAEAERPAKRDKGFIDPTYSIRLECYKAIKMFQRHYEKGLNSSQQLFLDYFEAEAKYLAAKSNRSCSREDRESAFEKMSSIRCKIETEFLEMKARIQQKILEDPDLPEELLDEEFDRQEEMIYADQATNNKFRQGMIILYDTLQPLFAERSQSIYPKI
jgi:hypothetical protein